MKVLISSHASLFPPEHGGAKNVRHLLESLAASGAQCRALVKMHPPAPRRQRFAGQHLGELETFRGEFSRWESLGSAWTHRNVSYRGIHGESADLARATAREIAEFHPDAVLMCDDSLEEGRDLYAVGAASGRLVFLAQTIHSLPFGPYAMKPSAAVTESIRQAARIIAPSRCVKDYIEKHLGRTAQVRYPDVFGAGPFPALGSYHNPYITMINPCPWKGSSILLNLARRRPDLAFAAVPTWGATPDLIEQLRAIPNITLLDETPDIDVIFRQTRALIAPSMCQEAFGLVSPEALLRGIPVVASDIAGLRESTLGVAPLIPVNPLPFDTAKSGTDHTKFEWSEPENPVEPWSRALDEILASEDAYLHRARRGKQAAERFVNGLAAQPILPLLA